MELFTEDRAFALQNKSTNVRETAIKPEHGIAHRFLLFSRGLFAQGVEQANAAFAAGGQDHGLFDRHVLVDQNGSSICLCDLSY